MGSTIRAFGLDDQHGNPGSVDDSTRLVLFSRDKALSKVAFGVLGQKGPAYLQEHHAALILDISPMPRIITWAFAKPKMRKRPFPILLDTAGIVTKEFPSREKSL